MALRVMDHLDSNVLIVHTANDFSELMWSKFTVSNSGASTLRLLAVFRLSELVEEIFKTVCVFIYDELYKVTKYDTPNTKQYTKKDLKNA